MTQVQGNPLQRKCFQGRVIISLRNEEGRGREERKKKRRWEAEQERLL